MIDFNICKNILCSTNEFLQKPHDVNLLRGHQEFDLNIFNYDANYEPYCIISMINYLRELDWKGDKPIEFWDKYKHLLPEFKWRMYGKEGDNGHIETKIEYVNAMKKSSFIWQLKGYEGYGHIVYNASALGKPIITRESDFKDFLWRELIEDGKTAIVINPKNEKETVDKIRYYAQPEEYRKMSQNAYNRFKQCVNFEKEAEQVKIFLEKLK
jgi:glycosyltransferase involved in cell wall biosynthesis